MMLASQSLHGNSPQNLQNVPETPEMQAHRGTRASFQVNPRATPGWHVGYAALKGLCRQEKHDVMLTGDEALLGHIAHRADERQAVLQGMQAYRQEFQFQLQKVLSKSEMQQGRK